MTDEDVRITVPTQFLTFYVDALDGDGGDLVRSWPREVTVVLSADALRALFAAASEYTHGAQYAYPLRRSARATRVRILRHHVAREYVRDILKAP